MCVLNILIYGYTIVFINISTIHMVIIIKHRFCIDVICRETEVVYIVDRYIDNKQMIDLYIKIDDR